MLENRIVTYSLLAHINNNNVGIRDFNDIFSPLIKRVISRMNCLEQNKGENLKEIKDCVFDMYSLDIPYPILSKIVKSISVEQNKDGETNFQFFDDGSFIINNFTFSEYEEVVQEQEAEVDYLNEVYNNFLISREESIENNSTIFEFLEQNKLSLSKYFSEQKLVDPELDFHLQAEFINAVQNNKRIYSILKKVYLGSIISSYLTIQEENLKTDLEFLIDTNFIIGLLDLGSIEEHHTCSKIVEIANNLGCKLSVLDFTIQETEALLNRTAEDFENSFLPKKIDPQSIYNACDRKDISKTDLQTISNNLAVRLNKDFNVYLVPNTVKLRNKARFSKDYAFYQKIRSTDYSALHDATAITYVKGKRQKNVSEFNKSKCWFVTNTSHKLKLNKNNGFLPEIIRADNLINVLWLTNPGINVSDVIDIGLSKLVSCAISNSMPNIRVLKELDANMQKYSSKGVEAEDVVRVASAIASKTITNLEELNKLANKKPDEFVKQIHEISEFNEKQEKELNAKVAKLINDITTNSEARIKEKIQAVNSKYENRIKEIESSKDKINKEKIEAIKQNKYETYSKLKPTFEALEKKSTSFATIQMLFYTVLPLIAIIIIYILIDKQKFQYYIFPISLIPAIITYLFFIIFKKQYSPQNIFEFLRERQRNRLIRKYSFDYKYYKNLENEIKIAL
ncbi:hypothetical protein SLH46_18220 [Draconibacterium sp. IB214405]|nr:hypothetical protein [Draconibacterium sp. IB214405]